MSSQGIGLLLATACLAATVTDCCRGAVAYAAIDITLGLICIATVLFEFRLP
jgi:hypothetical protein